MDFMELVRRRYSVRAYRPDPVGDEDLRRILEAAQLAPTAANRQAFQLIILAATALGLGTCWIGAFDPAAARQVLRLPDGVEPIASTPLGYPADQAGARKGKALSELVRYEHW